MAKCRCRHPGLPWLVLLSVGLGGQVAAQPAETIVLANENEPHSRALALDYMTGRGIPAENLCLLKLPVGEVISRRAYEQRLRDPLLHFLREGGFIRQSERDPKEGLAHQPGWETKASKVRYLVSMYGVPLRIADTKLLLGAMLSDRLRKPRLKNEAAVDSELALLLAPPYAIDGAQPNPLFRRHRLPETTDQAAPVLIAARLDGPSPDTVRRMMDDALDAEQFGLQGRGYFDRRSLADDYYVGDFWITEAYERLKREGYECVIDTNDQVWSVAYPMDDAAFYVGWYTEDVSGPFERDDFALRPGAVAYHLHSTSAETLKSTTQAWVGPLLHLGAAASMGAVREPYLSLTPDLQVFMERLCAGETFGAAAYMSLSHLSWQITVVGDPLYTPFKFTLDEQIRHLRAAGRAELDWALVRKINRSMREGHFRAAVKLAQEGVSELDSHVLREKLGDLYTANGDLPEAISAYREVIAGTTLDTQAIRVGAKLIRLYRAHHQPEDASALEEELKAAWPASAVLPWLDRFVR